MEVGGKKRTPTSVTQQKAGQLYKSLEIAASRHNAGHRSAGWNFLEPIWFTW
jgi:hypothetical protein